MELNFKNSVSYSAPSAIQIFGDSVYVRKNISTEMIHTSIGLRSVYTYDEAILTKEEFNQYVSELTVSNSFEREADSRNILSIISSQANNDENQLIIMEALADLYCMMDGGEENG